MTLLEYLSIALYDTAVFIGIVAITGAVYGITWIVKKVRARYGTRKT
jgi:hypothetical protein